MPHIKVWDLVTVDQENCPWNKNWYRIDMTKQGAQEYLNSVYELYASWGVDFIKNDCVFGNNFDNVTFSNIQAARKAMDKSGREMIYSLSPGNGAVSLLFLFVVSLDFIFLRSIKNSVKFSHEGVPQDK